MATKTAIRARLKSAKSAAERLEEDVRWLVRERAWETMGYANFSEMWEKENGFKTPRQAKVIAVLAIYEESEFRSQVFIAEKVGYGVSKNLKNPNGFSASVNNILKQSREGIAKDKISSDPYNGRKRSQPIRMGKLPNQLVTCGWSVYKYQADAIKEIARKANVPDSVVIRSALDAYIGRRNEEAS